VNTVLSLNIPVEAAINQEAVATYKEREAKRQKLKEEQVGFFCVGWRGCGVGGDGGGRCGGGGQKGGRGGWAGRGAAWGKAVATYKERKAKR
jgi:ubiquitin carboxyl-terminal hydrolase 5/13